MGPWLWCAVLAAGADKEAIVAQAREATQGDAVAVVPGMESPRWSFAVEDGVLKGRLTIETRRAHYAGPWAASYRSVYQESKTPFRYQVCFTPSGQEMEQTGSQELLGWCRARSRTAPLEDLDQRLWAALHLGTDEEGEEAVRQLSDAYFRHRSSIGMMNLLKHCVRSGGAGDPELVLKASEKLLWKLPRAKGERLAMVMSLEHPGWRKALDSGYPVNPDLEPFEAEDERQIEGTTRF